MTDPLAAQSAAIELLQQLGLSQYEAASYVALLRLGEGTAREVSETTAVPRTRIYDAVERLQERGLVDIKHASRRSSGRSRARPRCVTSGTPTTTP